MTDRIAIRGMRLYGRHGANPGEQDVPQRFDVDVEMEIDLANAARTDELADTCDYDAIYRAIRAVVSQKRFALLERLAQEIAGEVLRTAAIGAVTVTVAKPQLLGGATPSVTLRRARPET